jgi:glycosyltransferase involved in cell wall biosynthesis
MFGQYSCQTFKDFELILLDDGSPDKSGEICDEYAQRDARIRVIHKENEGINKTRMGGVTLAKAPWVTFSDDDDTMEPDALGAVSMRFVGVRTLLSGFTVLPEQAAWRQMLTIDDCRRKADPQWERHVADALGQALQEGTAH